MTRRLFSTSLRCTAFVLLAVLLAAGCTARQSDAQYTERLDQALQVRNATIQQLDDGSLRTADQFAAGADKVDLALAELDADRPPKRLQRGHDVMVDALDELGLLLRKLGRCEKLQENAPQDARVCRLAIGQDVFDELKNDFRESDAIYRTEGLSLPGLGSDEDEDGSGGSDTLNGPAGR